jgi:uncharacterized protein YbaA (DUF1428 family)
LPDRNCERNAAVRYIEGFITPVPTANKDVYRQHAESAVPLFKSFGAGRMVEAWGDDVPHGKVNDFYGAVKAKDDETVLFSWVEYPDKATRDAANHKMMTDPAMAEMAEMPFDAQRMIWSGFETLLEKGPGGAPGYIDGVVLPVQADKKDAYRAFASVSADVFVDNGALRVVEGWGDDLMDGKTTDYNRAVLREHGETVIYSWIEWPDKATRDSGWQAVMEDPRLAREAPFDGKRMIYGGFAPIVLSENA